MSHRHAQTHAINGWRGTEKDERATAHFDPSRIYVRITSASAIVCIMAWLDVPTCIAVEATCHARPSNLPAGGLCWTAGLVPACASSQPSTSSTVSSSDPSRCTCSCGSLAMPSSASFSSPPGPTRALPDRLMALREDSSDRRLDEPVLR